MTDVETEIDVVLLADAITPPLTGIGRYAWELAQRLENRRPNLRLKPLTLSGWTSLPRLAAGLQHAPEPRALAAGWTSAAAAGVKAALRRLPAAAGPVESARRFAYGLRLRRLQTPPRRTLVHGPNYFAPPTDRPTVITVHDLSTVLHPETHPAVRVKRVALMLEAAGKYGFDIITDATATKQDLVQIFGAAAEKIHVVPLGVGAPFAPTRPADRQRALAAYGLQDGGYCLSVAAAEPRKNLSRLLAAYATLPLALRRECPLILAGAAGWRNAGLLRDLAAAERDGWARHIGYVPLGDLPALYGGARLFAYVSFYEGFGLPVAEAMACGTPVLTSNASSLPEVAGGAALLADPGDEDDIARRLASALTDAPWRRQAAADGLARAAQLSWDHTAARTAAVYRAVLERA